MPVTISYVFCRWRGQMYHSLTHKNQLSEEPDFQEMVITSFPVTLFPATPILQVGNYNYRHVDVMSHSGLSMFMVVLMIHFFTVLLYKYDLKHL